MDILVEIRQKAAANRQTIVLPEGTEERSIVAAGQVVRDDFADLILLGHADTIRATAQKVSVDANGFQIIDPETSEDLEKYAALYAEKRAARGKPVSMEKAVDLLKQPLYYGAMMVNQGVVGGSVAGAVNTSGNVIAAAARVIGTKPGIKLASSFFMMVLPDTSFGENGLLIYADCGMVINPDAEELADIAITTAHSAKSLCGIEPRVGMLSFSTKGSAEHELVEKVQEATRIAKDKAPNLAIDGELQADAALIEAIGRKKAPDSPIAGKANVLIFPNLDAGNIAYKLTERLAHAKAIGPLLQGFAKPVNDLSRGCSATDIADTVAVTAVMAQNVEA